MSSNAEEYILVNFKNNEEVAVPQDKVYQWDENIVLEIHGIENISDYENLGMEFGFSNTTGNTYDCDDFGYGDYVLAKIPDEALQNTGELIGYLKLYTSESKYTTKRIMIQIIARPKPVEENNNE